MNLYAFCRDSCYYMIALLHKKYNFYKLKVTLSAVICANSQISNIQPKAFLDSNGNNPRISCSDVKRKHGMSFIAWKGRLILTSVFIDIADVVACNAFCVVNTCIDKWSPFICKFKKSTGRCKFIIWRILCRKTCDACG